MKERKEIHFQIIEPFFLQAMATKSNKKLLDLPVEIHRKIFENLSNDDIQTLTKTHPFFHELWLVFNTSIADKTIFDTRLDALQDEEIKKYKNIREIIIRSMVQSTIPDFIEYIRFACKQKYLRNFTMHFIADFPPSITIPFDIKWKYLTHLNLTFLTEKINADQDLAHFFLERAENLQEFYYDNGHLTNRSLNALANMHHLRAIKWTNVLIYDPYAFKQFIVYAPSIEILHFYYYRFTQVNLTLSILEAIYSAIDYCEFKEVKIYCEKIDSSNMRPILNQHNQFISTRAEDFVTFINIILPLLRKDILNEFKLVYLFTLTDGNRTIVDGILKYAILDTILRRVRRFCFNLKD